MIVFHRLFVEKEDNLQQEGESMEDIFDRVQKIFDTYKLDPLYYHINLVFEFLKLEYYNHYKVYRQAEKFYEEVNDAASNLLVNYTQYAFTSQFLISKIERHIRLNSEVEMQQENESLFEDFEQDPLSLPINVIYIVYRSLSYYYTGKYDLAAKQLNSLLNDMTLKKFPYVLIEIKTLLSLQYCLLKDFELFTQVSGSIQRQLRLLGKDDCENVLLFLKMLKIATSESKHDKEKKILAVIPRIKAIELDYFAPTRLVKLDDTFVDALVAIDNPLEHFYN
jgi:tetratricopeptide (TPR) repeat protein